jgi:ribosomal protein L11 methylase PrmA
VTAPPHDPPSGLLRVSVTAEGAGLDEAALLARMRAIFPTGAEEGRDERGRFEVAAYARPPMTLPGDLGTWRVEAVGVSRLRSWEELPPGEAIAGRLWVGPPTEEPAAGLLTVRIDRKHVFGSGGHATTAGCLTLLCELDAPLSVLDLGCGSGVLAVCAAMLGHGPVRAYDNDPLAVDAARQNARLNGVDVSVQVADVVTDALPPAALWLANLQHALLARMLARPDAPEQAIVSGLRTGDELEAPEYVVVSRFERAGWVTLRLRRA